ncbi:MAG: Fe-S cluster assembly protein SufD [Paludibacter sp.]|nr:Fe-S cluster assembly protein SufD [Paludibacter sp.]
MQKELQYINLFNETRDIICQNSSSLLNNIRQAEFEKFCCTGFPDNSDEKYQYTDMKKPLEHEYGLNIRRLQTDYDPQNIFCCDVSGIGNYNYLIVNDDFIGNPQPAILSQGVIIGSIKTISEQQPELIASYFASLTANKNDGIVALNGMFAQDGFFMYIPDNVIFDKPIQLINLMRASANLMANSRNLIIIGKNAKAQMLVCEHTAGDVHYFANRVTEIFVDENADFQYYTLENSGLNFANFSSVFIEQKDNSNVLTNLITLHNGITHNNTDIYLNGQQARTTLCGLVTTDQNQSANNSTAIFHNQTNCNSTELFKYILDENSLCGFSGKIFVEKDAQKTSAFQTNRNILLSQNAKMRTQPQLEIYADDVRCSHGATIGQLDNEAMFYMQQRGISKNEARLLLMYAFAAEIVDKINIVNLRTRIKMMTENRLRTGKSTAGKCAICL